MVLHRYRVFAILGLPLGALAGLLCGLYYRAAGGGLIFAVSLGTLAGILAVSGALLALWLGDRNHARAPGVRVALAAGGALLALLAVVCAAGLVVVPHANPGYLDPVGFILRVTTVPLLLAALVSGLLAAAVEAHAGASAAAPARETHPRPGVRGFMRAYRWPILLAIPAGYALGALAALPILGGGADGGGAINALSTGFAGALFAAAALAGALFMGLRTAHAPPPRRSTRMWLAGAGAGGGVFLFIIAGLLVSDPTWLGAAVPFALGLAALGAAAAMALVGVTEYALGRRERPRASPRSGAPAGNP